MLRVPAARALGSSSPLSSLRTTVRSQSLRQATRPVTVAAQQARLEHGHAISNPTLANIEKRWPEMSNQEQAELWMALRDRMRVPWNELTLQEKKASYWIAFGPHGPRALSPPGETLEVLKLITICLLGSIAAFGVIRYFAGPPPKTMTKEWQELSNEYLKSQKAEPITGYSAEGYTGPGMIQSKPSGKKPDDE